MKNTVVPFFWHIQYLYLMYSKVAWVLVSLETQVQPQIILDLYNLLDYFSVFYDYGLTNEYSSL